MIELMFEYTCGMNIAQTVHELRVIQQGDLTVRHDRHCCGRDGPVLPLWDLPRQSSEERFVDQESPDVHVQVISHEVLLLLG